MEHVNVQFSRDANEKIYNTTTPSDHANEKMYNTTTPSDQEKSYSDELTSQPRGTSGSGTTFLTEVLLNKQ